MTDMSSGLFLRHLTKICSWKMFHPWIPLTFLEETRFHLETPSRCRNFLPDQFVVQKGPNSYLKLSWWTAHQLMHGPTTGRLFAHRHWFIDVHLVYHSSGAVQLLEIHAFVDEGLILQVSTSCPAADDPRCRFGWPGWNGLNGLDNGWSTNPPNVPPPRNSRPY